MEDIEANILVANALVLGVGGGDGSRLPLREPPLPTSGLEADGADLVRTEDHWGIVLFPREPVDPSLLLLQFGIRADLPCPDGLLGDIRLITDHAEPLQADGGDDALTDGLVPQAAEEPLPEGKSQVPGSAGGQRDYSLPRLVRELASVARIPPGLEHRESVPFELMNEGANVVLGHQGEPADVLDSEALGRGQDHLSSLPFDGILGVANCSAEGIAFLVGDVSYP